MRPRWSAACHANASPARCSIPCTGRTEAQSEAGSGDAKLQAARRGRRPRPGLRSGRSEGQARANSSRECCAVRPNPGKTSRLEAE
jgi:hypothetical protein